MCNYLIINCYYSLLEPYRYTRRWYSVICLSLYLVYHVIALGCIFSFLSVVVVFFVCVFVPLCLHLFSDVWSFITINIIVVVSVSVGLWRVHVIKTKNHTCNDIWCFMFFHYFPSKDSGQVIPRVVESCIRYINLYGELVALHYVDISVKIMASTAVDFEFSFRR